MVPGLLGVALAVALVAVGAYRAAHRDAAGALMAFGMAWMAVSVLPSGPWWAAGFALLALWPLVHRAARERCGGGPVPHVVGGVAMVVMCLLPAHPAPAEPSALLLASAGSGGHHHGYSAELAAALPGNGPAGPLDTALHVLCWSLAAYFLFTAVLGMTRRDPVTRSLAITRPGVLTEAAMALCTALMLVAMT